MQDDAETRRKDGDTPVENFKGKRYAGFSTSRKHALQVESRPEASRTIRSVGRGRIR